MGGRAAVLRWVELVVLFALVPLAFSTVLLRYATAHFALIPRLWVVERYARPFRSETSFVIFSALCFAGGHVIFRNWVTVVTTFVGGLIFMRTYRLTRSHLLASFEHALYGVFALAIGIGRFLILAAA